MPRRVVLWHGLKKAKPSWRFLAFRGKMAAYGGAMADIFISYAREDGERAKRLAEALEQHGWSVWWDPDIHPGETWDQVIERELDAARCVTVLWSKRSILKDWVRVEATEGLDRRILVPALIEDVRPPLRFRHVQAASLIDWNGEDGHRGFERLLKALMAKLDAPQQPQTPTPQQTPSTEPPEPLPESVAKHSSEPSSPASGEKSIAIKDLSDFSGFRDISERWCPEMVVLPAGEFMMGSPDKDEYAEDAEKPQHKVKISHRLAVGRYPVTFQEYDCFCRAAGYNKADDNGWGRGRRPVINVSWNDAKAYLEWLGNQTGKSYRLLSEAEWEYACRAGTMTEYSCGNRITDEDANFDKNLVMTTEVGSYPENPWGLYDMHGNVWEWMEDFWHQDYNGAPDDGSPWITGGDNVHRVLRGGSWINYSRGLRSAARIRDKTDTRTIDLGLRLARTV